MVKKKDDIPEWVTDEIQNAKFKKPKELKISGYVLEFYHDDDKIDVQLYDALEDGRQIVTMDVAKKIKIKELEKGIVYENLSYCFIWNCCNLFNRFDSSECRSKWGW